MRKPRLLDLFCGAGGAAMGYHRAGFEVTGVDIALQPNFPFEFHQADATTFPLEGFDAIHASPPCQDHMRSPSASQKAHGTGWMLAGTRRRLLAQDAPWVIENVPGAEMRVDCKLCGCMFGLPNLRRERWFETSWHGFDLQPPCHHPEPVMSVTGTGFGTRLEFRNFGRWPKKADWQRAMGIDWMTPLEMTQAIPPAYAEYLGRRLLEQLTSEAAA